MAKNKKDDAYDTFDSHDGPTIPYDHVDDAEKMDGPSRPFTPNYGPRENLQHFGESESVSTGSEEGDKHGPGSMSHKMRPSVSPKKRR